MRVGLLQVKLTYTVESRSVHFIVSIALEYIQNLGTVGEFVSVGLFDALTAEGHAAENNRDGGFGRHGVECLDLG